MPTAKSAEPKYKSVIFIHLHVQIPVRAGSESLLLSLGVVVFEM